MGSGENVHRFASIHLKRRAGMQTTKKPPEGGLCRFEARSAQRVGCDVMLLPKPKGDGRP
jgi:hypothetical protein